MDNSRSSLLNMPPYFFHGKSVDELGQSWLCTTVELESLKMQAQEEIKRRDEQLSYVKELLYKAMKERDEALQKCQTLQCERQLLQQQMQVKEVKNATPADPLSVLSSIEDESNMRSFDSNKSTNNLSSSDCDDQSIVSSPATGPIPIPRPFLHQQPYLTQISSKVQSFHDEVMERLLPDTSNNYPLPEKGKLLKAVMNAGPLLQTLLLAGPLPQWRHPPPPLESFEIPPVTININSRIISRKRGLTGTTHCSDSSIDHQSHKIQKQNNTTLLHQHQ